ncbi:hypothetical protein [Niallia sp. MER 6]|uniref:hypothetical protein n=1 Tax=Niallia sp. MER 6 TaxID=2939567 RepID=UPI002040CBE1|nr:hypothetical protein [Niallia sp. MER 6]MCM3029831.1 hypothetical protein [Niallia sp. MER 6]
MNLHGALEFLNDYPEMSFGPMKSRELNLRGTFRFRANYEGGPIIEDRYELEILIPEGFPIELPKVKELKGKIPRDNNYHINPDDTLCVGSPLRVILKLQESATLNTYAEECLVPYLYAVSYKLKNGGDFIFGELEHGKKGIFNDYCDILGLTNPNQVAKALSLLCMKKRIANKKICPCECGKRLGSCNFHIKLNTLRLVAPRSFYKKHLLDLI